jgi:hypothetical protein
VHAGQGFIGKVDTIASGINDADAIADILKDLCPTDAILECDLALETFILALATFVLAPATFALALATFILALVRFVLT